MFPIEEGVPARIKRRTCQPDPFQQASAGSGAVCACGLAFACSMAVCCARPLDVSACVNLILSTLGS